MNRLKKVVTPCELSYTNKKTGETNLRYQKLPPLFGCKKLQITKPSHYCEN